MFQIIKLKYKSLPMLKTDYDDRCQATAIPHMTLWIGWDNKKSYSLGCWSFLTPCIPETVSDMSNLFEKTGRKFHKESKEKKTPSKSDLK